MSVATKRSWCLFIALASLLKEPITVSECHGPCFFSYNLVRSDPKVLNLQPIDIDFFLVIVLIVTFHVLGYLGKELDYIVSEIYEPLLTVLQRKKVGGLRPVHYFCNRRV